MSSKGKYYVVWKGRRTGIFDSWEACSEQVNGFPGAVYKSFPDREAAQRAFAAPARPRSRRPPRPRVRPAAGVQPSPILDSYAVDASCIGPPGPVEYRGVETRTGRQVFRRGPYANGTNNIGEFLAIVHALALLQEAGSTLPVYSDSRTAISWVKRKQCRTKHPRDDSNAELFELVARGEAWLQEHEYQNELLKWETEAWGEIPADFGRKPEF